MAKSSDPDQPGLALKIGIAGMIGLGAVVSGLLISRGGRRLVKEAWQGRRRTRIEDRVLDVLWADPVVGRRDFEVEEIEPGLVRLSGVVRGRREHGRALRLTRAVKDVQAVRDDLIVERRGRPPVTERARRLVTARRRRPPED